MENIQFPGVGLIGTFRSEFYTKIPTLHSCRYLCLESRTPSSFFSHREALFLILTTIGETLFGKKHACKFIAQVNGIGEIVADDYLKCQYNIKRIDAGKEI